MELVPIYSTPVWMSVFPEFDGYQETFLSCVENFKENNPQGEEKSNINGYQSPFTLQMEKQLSPLFNYICSLCLQATQDLNFVNCDVFLTNAWVNFNDSRNCMNTEHIHGETFSGVFYLKVPEGSGKLVINNSGINRLWNGCNLTQSKNQFTGEMIKIEPEEGSLIIFPSYLPHSVETNNHDDKRISISFNVIALPKGVMQVQENAQNIHS
jgi:uncharacterized protein (TIGR02466 family)